MELGNTKKVTAVWDKVLWCSSKCKDINCKNYHTQRQLYETGFSIWLSRGTTYKNSSLSLKMCCTSLPFTVYSSINIRYEKSTPWPSNERHFWVYCTHKVQIMGIFIYLCVCSLTSWHWIHCFAPNLACLLLEAKQNKGGSKENVS
jgi:hypothetical protein